MHSSAMKTNLQLMPAVLAILPALVLHLTPTVALAQGTAFTYQGRLSDGGNPASGSYDVAFTLFATNTGGSAVAGPVTNAAVAVSNGLFTTTVDLGNAFPGADRWLELAVSTNGANVFAMLAPRQPLTPTPYAIYAANAASATSVSGNVSASQLTGTISSNNLGAGSITTTMLATGAVGANQLAAGAVTTPALANGAVTATKVATVTNWFALTIANPTPETGENFGHAVAAMGSDQVLIGARRANTASLFSTEGMLLTTFTNPTLNPNDSFGSSVAAVGSGAVLIGAESYDDNDLFVSDVGAAYLFSTNGTLLTTFFNPTPADSDRFGDAVASVGSDHEFTFKNSAHAERKSNLRRQSCTGKTPCLLRNLVNDV
jgi:hypothetical protein